MSCRVFGWPLPLPYHKHTKSGTLFEQSSLLVVLPMVDQVSWVVDAKSDVYLRLPFVDDMCLRCAMQDFLNGKFLPRGKINKKTHAIV